MLLASDLGLKSKNFIIRLENKNKIIPKIDELVE